jgi:hypothetical protein
METSTRNLANLKELAAYMILSWSSTVLAYRSSSRNLLLQKNILYAHPRMCAHSNFQLVQVCEYLRDLRSVEYAIPASCFPHPSPLNFIVNLPDRLMDPSESTANGNLGNRGALLIMSRPQTKHLPIEFPYEKLRDIRVLSRKVIVMDVVICPAYALYLSQESESQFQWMMDMSEFAPFLLLFPRK